MPFTIDVFGLTTSAPTDMGIGQMWEDLVTTADVVLPMVYPSHYVRGYYNLAHPNSEPYKVIRRAMQDALGGPRRWGRRPRSGPTSRPSPWASPATRPSRSASRSAPRRSWGIRSWVLWNPRSAYDPGIFRPRAAAAGMTADDTGVPIGDGMTLEPCSL